MLIKMDLDNIQNDSLCSTENTEMLIWDKCEVSPKTPKRQFGKELQNDITETPSRSKEITLMTPLRSTHKINLLPRLSKHMSLGVLDLVEGFSPNKKENTLKRDAPDELDKSAVKLLKTDENHSVSKARTALFQEQDHKAKLKNLTISTKHFYQNSNEKKNYKVIHKLMETKLQNKSLSEHSKYHKRSLRRHTIGGINAGVSHGIRKPKPKPKTNSNGKKTNNNTMVINDMQNSMKVQEDSLKERQETSTSSVVPIERTLSPEVDCNKRFFKTKQSPAVVKISNNIKLKIASNGEVKLNQKNYRGRKQAHKRIKTTDITFDATDLMVDEPEIEKTVEQSNIDNILKILENDWADDDYDTMDTLISKQYANISPLKPVAILNDVIMSPASELTNMTLTMNIKDNSTLNTYENINTDNNNKKADEIITNTSTMNIKDISTPETSESISMDSDEQNPDKNITDIQGISTLNVSENSFTDNTDKKTNEKEPKYYPLFNKGYVAKVFDEIDNKSMHNTKQTKNWQLSVKLNGGENQYLLDAGQKNFGATQCMECGVVYQIGDPEDENAHLNYHNNKKVLKFPGWKTERVIMEDPFTQSRIILIEPGDSKQCWKKVTEVLEYVDRDLGLTDTKLSDYEQKRVYLYIRDKVIIGVLVAQHITTAYRMIPELLELNCCTVESSPAKCGIDVVWTDMNHRKQGIATKLVDILRNNFYFGYVMSLDDIAFSIPSSGGKIFAEKYTKTRNFKVYS
nr:N-acetyltransferase ESCO1 [Osmia lignaria]XP_034187481.1 N-acetyltransferase ESCO1 [Osmia lignaria]XP_034187487.1 N-acetyltransferase ESCO1 [Osmia lignaria]